MGRIGRFLAENGRVLVGWDEILEGTADGRRLPPDSVVMSWRVRPRRSSDPTHPAPPPKTSPALAYVQRG